MKGIPVSSNAKSSYDSLPETGKFLSGFSEANLVFRDANGKETTLYDCIGNDKVICAALDGRVSPDGTKIAFWVVEAESMRPTRWTLQGNLTIPLLGNPRHATIHIHDLATGKTTNWGQVNGQFDMHPDWIDNDKLVFVSNRSRVHPIHLAGKMPYSRWALQPYVATIDQTGFLNIGPHQDVVFHPYPLSDGNLLLSRWAVDGRFGYDQGNGNVTLQNEFWLEITDQHGGGSFMVLGAHGLQVASALEPGRTNSLLSLHFQGEMAPKPDGSAGELLTGNYYRSNHVGGLGQVWLIDRLPDGVEGAKNSMFPRITVLNPYGQEEDNPTGRVYENGRHGGKMAWPVGVPGRQVMVTLGTGNCYAINLNKITDEYLKGGPGCDTGIYVTTTVPSRHPDDLIKIVDHPDRHEFSADIALPYSATYGKLMPEPQEKIEQTDPRGDKFCSLEVIDSRISKLFNPGGSKPCTNIGACIDPGRSPDEFSKLAIYAVPMNKTAQSNMPAGSIPKEGHVETLLGYATPEKDGSINVIVPCEIPIRMRGVAKDGSEFLRDQIKHSLRTGEARRCIGCHGGHTENEYHEIGGMDAWNDTIASKKPPQELSPR